MLRRIKKRLNARESITRFVDHRTHLSARLASDLPYPIRRQADGERNQVMSYWNDHTVRSKPFASASESLSHIENIDRQYPFYHQMMGLHDLHENQVIVEYGCGPGNDLVGFLAYSKPKKVIGIDVSEKSLMLASHRLGLHHFPQESVELLLISDTKPGIPLEDNSVDYIHSQGVLHHTTHPETILKELYRLLKPGCQARIMVYNFYSLWAHLYVAYELMTLHHDYPGLSLEEAFSKSTDGENCPIARCYKHEDFLQLCREAGFSGEYVGGYFNMLELSLLKKYKDEAVHSAVLGVEHRQFLQDLTYDDQGYPLYQSKYAGVGGVYELVKPKI